MDTKAGHAVLAAALLLAGCATFQAYEGPRLPRADVAILSPALLPRRQILLQAFDGRRLGLVHERIEMRPGPHEVVTIVQLWSQGRRVAFEHRLRFTAAAGGEYVLYAEYDLYGPRTFILDERSGREIAECVTRPQAPVVSAPPPFRR